MEIVLFLLFVWSLVTVLGHGTWVAVRALVRGILAGTGEESLPQHDRREQEDLVAARRVLQRMSQAKLIEPAEANRWHQQLSQLPVPPQLLMQPVVAEEVLVATLVDQPSRSS